MPLQTVQPASTHFHPVGAQCQYVVVALSYSIRAAAMQRSSTPKLWPMQGGSAQGNMRSPDGLLALSVLQPSIELNRRRGKTRQHIHENGKRSPPDDPGLRWLVGAAIESGRGRSLSRGRPLSNRRIKSFAIVRDRLGSLGENKHGMEWIEEGGPTRPLTWPIPAP